MAPARLVAALLVAWPSPLVPVASAQFGGGGVATVLADQLVVESQRLVEDARLELGGTRQGRNVEIRGNALRGAAESYRSELMQRHGDDRRRLQALDAVDRALVEVHRALNSPPGTAPRAADTARRLDRLVDELRRDSGPGYGPGPGFPPPITPPNPGYDAGRLARVAGSTATGAVDLRVQIDRQVGRYPPYDGVARDLDGLASGLDQMAELARRQSSIGRLRSAFRQVGNQAGRIGPVLDRSRPPAGIARGWLAVERGLGEIERMLGQGGGIIIDPNRPIIIDPPGFGQLPWPIPPGGGGGGLPPPPSAGAIPLIDRAIAELDAYLLAIQPHLATIPEGPQFHRDARELRNALLPIRQSLASGGWNPSIAGLSRQADAILQRLLDRTARVSRGQIGPNNARILRVRDLMAQANSMLGPTPY